MFSRESSEFWTKTTQHQHCRKGTGRVQYRVQEQIHSAKIDMQVGNLVVFQLQAHSVASWPEPRPVCHDLSMLQAGHQLTTPLQYALLVLHHHT